MQNYVPDWFGQLDELKQMALLEMWQFKKLAVETKNQDTTKLERYINTIFRKQAIEYNSEPDKQKTSKYIHIENECVCFHTGLYTPKYKGIYAYFDRS